MRMNSETICMEEEILKSSALNLQINILLNKADISGADSKNNRNLMVQFESSQTNEWVSWHYPIRIWKIKGEPKRDPAKVHDR